MAAICEAFGISRKTGYKWLERFHEHGRSGLIDQSRAPKNSPHQISEKMRKLLRKTRKDHEYWGPRKIIAHLEEKYPRVILPASSTVGEFFKKEGLIRPTKRRVRPIPHEPPVVEAKLPNDVWATDFKGEFRMKDGRLCYPLTISDHVSRFILCCSGQSSNNILETKRAFEKTFKEFGLPKAILSDNGVPFSTPSGLSQLSVWWIKLGIRPIRTQPGCPQQNGRHERMHKTLKQETTRPPSKNMRTQQRAFNLFVQEYNNDRPHEALGNRTPSRFYKSSRREMPQKVPPIDYPKHFEQRAIGNNGEIKWFSNAIFISKALEYERVGLEEIDDGLHLVYFGPIIIGHLNARTRTFERRAIKY